MTGRKAAIELLVLSGLTVLLALLGPFGTFDLPWPSRLLDWLLFMMAGTLCFRPVIGAVGLLASHGAIRLPLSVVCGCVLAAFPATLLVAWRIAGLRWRQVTLDALLSIYAEVLLVGGLATVLQFAIARRRAARTAGPPPSPDTGPAAPPLPSGAEPLPGTGIVAADFAPFLRRLPPHLGRDLICLVNEDHYVHAHTGRGSVLILMRMADAVSELASIDGLRTHRSWWVAREAVTAIARRDRAIVLILRNGVEAPVARAMVPTLRAAGWLDDTYI